MYLGLFVSPQQNITSAIVIPKTACILADEYSWFCRGQLHWRRKGRSYYSPLAIDFFPFSDYDGERDDEGEGEKGGPSS